MSQEPLDDGSATPPPATGKFDQYFFHGVLSDGRKCFSEEWVESVGGTYDKDHVRDWKSDAGYTLGGVGNTLAMTPPITPLGMVANAVGSTLSASAHKTFDEEVQKSVDAIREEYERTKVPPMLHGHSAGGVHAIETANRLSQEGIPVTVVTYGTPKEELRLFGVKPEPGLSVLAFERKGDEILGAEHKLPGGGTPDESIKVVSLDDSPVSLGRKGQMFPGGKEGSLDHLMAEYENDPKVHAELQKNAKETLTQPEFSEAFRKLDAEEAPKADEGAAPAPSVEAGDEPAGSGASFYTGESLEAMEDEAEESAERIREAQEKAEAAGEEISGSSD